MSILNTIRADFDDELNPSITVPFPKSITFAGYLFIVYSVIGGLASMCTFGMFVDSSGVMNGFKVFATLAIGVFWIGIHAVTGISLVAKQPFRLVFSIIVTFLPMLSLIFWRSYLLVT